VPDVDARQRPNEGPCADPRNSITPVAHPRERREAAGPGSVLEAGSTAVNAGSQSPGGRASRIVARSRRE
jgi:hypothetical protein